MSTWEKWKLIIQIRMGQEGRHRVLKHIWDEYYQSLLWYIHSICSSDSAEAEDMLQEVMLKIYDKLESYDSTYAISTWIYTITRNHCINHSQKKRLHLSSEADWENITGGNDPEQEVLLQDQVKGVEEFLDQLPDADREIAFFRFYEDMSYRDIAALTGKSQGTLKYRVHAIRKALKKYLGDKYEE